MRMTPLFLVVALMGCAEPAADAVRNRQEPAVPAVPSLSSPSDLAGVWTVNVIGAEPCTVELSAERISAADAVPELYRMRASEGCAGIINAQAWTPMPLGLGFVGANGLFSATFERHPDGELVDTMGGLSLRR